MGITYFQNLEDTLSLTQGEDPDHVNTQNANNSLILSDSVYSSPYTVALEDVISFSDVTSEPIPFQSVFNILRFYEGDGYVAPSGEFPAETQIPPAIAFGTSIFRSLTDLLVLLQDEVVSSIKAPSVGSNFSLSDSVVTGGPIQRDVGHNLSLRSVSDLDPGEFPSVGDPDFTEKVEALLKENTLKDSVVYQFAVKNISLTSYLSFSDLGRPGQYAVASNHITLTDSVEAVEYEDLIDYLYLAHSVTGINTKGTSSSLVLEDLATFTAVFSRALSTSLSLVHVPYGISPRTNPDEAADPLNTLTCPIVGDLPYVVFYYPTRDPTITVQLRPPLFRNQENFNFRRVRRRTRGGELELYRRSIWPKWTRLRFTYSNLSEDERYQVFKLLKASLGKDITLVDWEGRNWTGIITNPQADFEQTGRGCRHEITLEFQGACE